MEFIVKMIRKGAFDLSAVFFKKIIKVTNR